MNILLKMISFILIFASIVACSDNQDNINSSVEEKEQVEVANSEGDSIDDSNTTVLTEEQTDFEGYKFVYGYREYDEEKYGFSNPAYLKVFKNDKLILSDNYFGEGTIYVKSLGYQNISGKKLFFILNIGTEACDYVQASRYYFISPESDAKFINEYISFNGGDGYSSRFSKHIFPKKSKSNANTLTIVEAIIFNENDQPNLFDSTRITFNGNNFKINKLSNNLEKSQ